MPGNPFDALGKSTNKSRPPRAKETMFVLASYSVCFYRPDAVIGHTFGNSLPILLRPLRHQLLASLLWLLPQAPIQHQRPSRS